MRFARIASKGAGYGKKRQSWQRRQGAGSDRTETEVDDRAFRGTGLEVGTPATLAAARDGFVIRPLLGPLAGGGGADGFPRAVLGCRRPGGRQRDRRPRGSSGIRGQGF